MNKKERAKQIRKSLFLRQLYMTKNVNYYTSSVFKEGNFVMRVASGIAHYIWKVIPVTNEWLSKNGRRMQPVMLADHRSMHSLMIR